eukprot:512069_1
MERNKLLRLTKKDLIKQCKKQKLNINGCKTKTDFVDLLLKKKNVSRNKNKKKKPKKSSHSKPEQPNSINLGINNECDEDNMTPVVSTNNTSDILIFSSNNNTPNSVHWGFSPYPNDNEQKDNNNNNSNHNNEMSFDNIPSFAPHKSNNLSVMDENTEENIQIFIKVDNALGDYYKYFGKNDYFNDDGKGKFILFCQENNFLNNSNDFINAFGESSDLNSEATDCKYLDFDEMFPLTLICDETNDNNSGIDDMTYGLMRKIEIYNVIQYCYNNGKSPF